MGGTTPTLTVGDAGAEDAKIVFDGNAQDFHIGIDDSADSLTIGLGSALGTTSHMIFNSIGAVTKPLQPAFHASLASTVQSNFAAAATTLQYKSERFDNNGDFNTTNYTFTAPVTGRYFLAANIELSNIDNANDYMRLIMSTSNLDYYQGIVSPNLVFSSECFSPGIATIGVDVTL